MPRDPLPVNPESPAQRDQYYNILNRHDGAASPDLQPNPNARTRNVQKMGKDFIGPAPGLTPITGPGDNADRSVKIQLPLLQ